MRVRDRTYSTALLYLEWTQLRPRRDIARQIKDALKTAQTMGISSAHRTVACNFLCALLEKCLASSFFAIRALYDSECLCSHMLLVYLNRSEGTKSKCMRQLLATLLSIILKSTKLSLKTDFRRWMEARFMGTFMGESHMSDLKPTLQALEYMLNKDIIHVSDLLCLYQSRVDAAPQTSEVGVKFDVCCSAISQNKLPQSQLGETMVADPVAIQPGGALKLFIHTMLKWVTHRDLATSAGHLTVMFFRKFHSQGSVELPFYDPSSQLPWWAACVQESVQEQEGALDAYRKYILPGLLKLNLHDDLLILDRLHLRDLLRGEARNDCDLNNLLLFTILRVMKELGLIRDSGKATQEFAQL